MQTPGSGHRSGVFLRPARCRAMALGELWQRRADVAAIAQCRLGDVDHGRDLSVQVALPPIRTSRRPRRRPLAPPAAPGTRCASWRRVAAPGNGALPLDWGSLPYDWGSLPYDCAHFPMIALSQITARPTKIRRNHGEVGATMGKWSATMGKWSATAGSGAQPTGSQPSQRHVPAGGRHAGNPQFRSR
jgi:hypothetical protein